MSYTPAAVPDETVFTEGTSPLIPVGGEYNDSPSVPSSGQAAAARITPNRALHVNVRAQNGTELATSAAPLRVDPTGTTTQPVSGSLSVSGLVSENLTQIGGTAIDVNSGTSSAGTQRVVIATDQPQLTNALKVDGSAVTQPVSGTFWQSTQPVSAASLPLPAGASTSAKQPALGTAGTPSADVLTVQGASGMTALKVDGSGVTQPVSGTFWQATQPVSVASLPLPTGAATSAKQPALGTAGSASADVLTVQGASGMTALKVDGSAVTQPVSIAAAVAVTGTFWQATQPVSAASLPLPSGASTAAKQPALGTAGSASSDVITVQGIASMTALKVDGSGVTQPVSGTFWQTTQPVSAASLPLPAGAATSAKQPALGTAGSAAADVITVQGIASMTALKVDGSAVTQPVSGTVTANAGSGTFATSDGNAAAQGSSTSGQKGFLELGAVTTAAPTYTTAQSSPLSLNTSGGLRVDGSGVTQPVSGTFWQATQPVSAASLPLPAGAATSAKQPALGTAGSPSADVITVQGSASGTPQPVSGTLSVQPAIPTTSEYTTASISFNSTGDNTVIAGVSGQTIRVFGVLLTMNGTGTLIIKNGAAALTGAMTLTAMVLTRDGQPHFVTGTGNNFVINQSGTAQVSGCIWYTQS